MPKEPSHYGYPRYDPLDGFAHRSGPQCDRVPQDVTSWEFDNNWDIDPRLFPMPSAPPPDIQYTSRLSLPQYEGDEMLLSSYASDPVLDSLLRSFDNTEAPGDTDVPLPASASASPYTTASDSLVATPSSTRFPTEEVDEHIARLARYAQDAGLDGFSDFDAHPIPGHHAISPTPHFIHARSGEVCLGSATEAPYSLLSELPWAATSHSFGILPSESLLAFPSASPCPVQLPDTTNESVPGSVPSTLPLVPAPSAGGAQVTHESFIAPPQADVQTWDASIYPTASAQHYPLDNKPGRPPTECSCGSIFSTNPNLKRHFDNKAGIRWPCPVPGCRGRMQCRKVAGRMMACLSCESSLLRHVGACHKDYYRDHDSTHIKQQSERLRFEILAQS
ncbi:hypothetical protein NM688_g8843 [Phlebia brevispora]|uniref:Uncharacterized protein n=1 Tax=Phlebia brevispora TaxID=194682 RepID=A0ACC1RP83_9APHY|nr:hypothetical protein NM688_g8843 [Phlebia brevispora]